MDLLLQLVAFLTIFLSSIIPSVSSAENKLQHEETPPVQEAVLLTKACSSSTSKEQCYAEKFYDLSLKHTLSYSIQTLDKLKEVDRAAMYCHGYAHEITSAQVIKNPEEWLKLFSQINPDACTRGYFHGIIQGHLSNQPSFTFTNKSMHEVCNAFLEEKRGFEAQKLQKTCAHTVGHMILVEKKADASDAIAVCKTFTEDLDYDCYSGVFMENMNKDTLMDHGLADKYPWTEENTAEQEAVCKNYTSGPASACYESLGHMYAFISGNDNLRLLRLCSSAITGADQEKCYLSGIGFMAYFMFQNKDEKEPVPLFCEPYDNDEERYKKCLKFLARYIIVSDRSLRVPVENQCEKIEIKERKAACLQSARNVR